MSKPDDIAAAAPPPLPASAAADAAAVDAATAELQRGLATDPDAVAAAAAAVHNLALSARQATEEELASQAAARKRTEGRSVASLLANLSAEEVKYVNNGLAVLDASVALSMSAFHIPVPPPAPGYTISQAMVDALASNFPDELEDYKLPAEPPPLSAVAAAEMHIKAAGVAVAEMQTAIDTAHAAQEKAFLQVGDLRVPSKRASFQQHLSELAASADDAHKAISRAQHEEALAAELLGLDERVKVALRVDEAGKVVVEARVVA